MAEIFDVSAETFVSIFGNSLPWRWCQYIPPKLFKVRNRLHDVSSKYVITFVVTDVRSSNITQQANLDTRLGKSRGQFR